MLQAKAEEEGNLHGEEIGTSGTYRIEKEEHLVGFVHEIWIGEADNGYGFDYFYNTEGDLLATNYVTY